MSEAAVPLPGGMAAPGDRVTHRRVLAIALPMTLAFLSTPLLGFVDTTVIGRLGSATLLGGIAVGAIIFNVLFTVFNFLRMGTTGLTAQASGAGETREVSAILIRTLLVAAAAGLAMIALSAPLLETGLAWMGASDEVANATRDYFAIRIFSAPFALANYAVLGWFLGLGRAGIGLLLQTLLNGMNIVLNIWFVLGLGWGVAGVAWGTLIGEAVTAVAGLALIAWLGGRSLVTPLALVFDRASFLRLVSINRDIMVRSAALVFAFSFFTAESARQTDLILAANAVLMNFFMVASYFLDGFATAAEQLVGTAIGRRSRAMVKGAVRLTVLWGLGLGAATSVVLWLAGPAIIDFVTTAPDVRLVARQYLPWAALLPVVGALAFEFDGVYIGATWGREMRNMMLASLAVAGLVWWVAMPVIGNHGLWLALVTFLVARGLTLMARFPACLDRAFAAS
jgi:MATE family multidrug resistance protein